MATRRRLLPWFLFVTFVVVPIVEIYVLIQVGQVIGAPWTIVLLILDSLLGSWLIKREGGRAWQALRAALQTGRMPSKELADGGLILIGGTLMLSPGFVLDVLGLLLILPPTRPLFRGVLARFVSQRVTLVGPGANPTGPGAGPGAGPGVGPGNRRRPGGESSGPTVRGEVVDD